MAKFLVLCLGVLAAAISSTKALTSEELLKIEADMLVYVKDCADKFSVSDDDLKEAKEKENIDNISPCFLACVFKNANLINDKGLYDPEVVTGKLSDKYLSNDEDKAKMAEIAKDCTKVNDESVSDGAEGCERAKHLLGCLAKHKDALKGGR
ncbi:uncharacterized protein LOC135078239 [Ostrinia nubilalis]|uniref:uncharacterized protein LOC135078239 n=1 Tax=Ostrinia nubilalis TaxID=29057 RepID=UPI0030822115